MPANFMVEKFAASKDPIVAAEAQEDLAYLQSLLSAPVVDREAYYNACDEAFSKWFHRGADGKSRGIAHVPERPALKATFSDSSTATNSSMGTF